VEIGAGKARDAQGFQIPAAATACSVRSRALLCALIGGRREVGQWCEREGGCWAAEGRGRRA
jgi:hypothetical protein